VGAFGIYLSIVVLQIFLLGGRNIGGVLEMRADLGILHHKGCRGLILKIETIFRIFDINGT
jgi:hypothetical protein